MAKRFKTSLIQNELKWDCIKSCADFYLDDLIDINDFDFNSV